MKVSKNIWRNYAKRYYWLTGELAETDWSVSDLQKLVDDIEAEKLVIYVRGAYYDASEQFAWTVRLQCKLRWIWRIIKTSFLRAVRIR